MAPSERENNASTATPVALALSTPLPGTCVDREVDGAEVNFNAVPAATPLSAAVSPASVRPTRSISPLPAERVDAIRAAMARVRVKPRGPVSPWAERVVAATSAAARAARGQSTTATTESASPA